MHKWWPFVCVSANGASLRAYSRTSLCLEGPHLISSINWSLCNLNSRGEFLLFSSSLFRSAHLKIREKSCILINTATWQCSFRYHQLHSTEVSLNSITPWRYMIPTPHLAITLLSQAPEGLYFHRWMFWGESACAWSNEKWVQKKKKTLCTQAPSKP